MSNNTSYPTITLSREVFEYLSMVLYSQGEAAWYENQIELDLTDYDGAIKSVVNQMETWKALCNEELAPKFYFETEIKHKNNSSPTTITEEE